MLKYTISYLLFKLVKQVCPHYPIVKSLREITPTSVSVIKDYWQKHPPLSFSAPHPINTNTDSFFDHFSKVKVFDRYLAVISNAVLKTKSGLLIIPHAGVSLEHVHTFEDFIRGSTDFYKFKLNKTYCLSGNYYSLIGFRPGAHYHILSDFGCRLVTDLEYLPNDIKYLMPANTTEVIIDFYKALGIKEESMVILPQNRIVSCEKLYWSPPSTISGFNHPDELKRVQAKVWEYYNFHNQKLPQDLRLYISRADAKRKIQNEEELFDNTLSKHGFSKVVLSALSFAEQVNLFYRASIIVGPHGAGFVNLMFCREKTRVLELFPHKAPRGGTCYWSMSQSLNLAYTYLLNQTISEPYEESDIKVDCGLINSYLDKCNL